jgi:hypothetical protein
MHSAFNSNKFPTHDKDIKGAKKVVDKKRVDKKVRANKERSIGEEIIATASNGHIGLKAQRELSD